MDSFQGRTLASRDCEVLVPSRAFDEPAAFVERRVRDDQKLSRILAVRDVHVRNATVEVDALASAGTRDE